jgi:hypothetical protein
VACFLALAVAACQRETPFPLQRPFEADPRTTAEVTADDIAVFEAVIDAYARKGLVLGTIPSPPDHRHPLSDADVMRRSETAKLRLLAHTHTCAGARQSATGWRDLDENRLEVLLVAPSTVLDFERRNAQKVSLDRFTPQHLRVIRVQEGDPSRDLLSPRLSVGRNGPFHDPPVLVLSLPGYSASRGAAVVEVSSYTRPYGGGSHILYLRRVAGRWKVVARHLGCVT